MRQNEARFVGRAQIAGHREHRLALDLIREDRNRHEVGAQRHLAAGEQRPAREREILVAGFAVPAQAALAAAAVDRRAAAMRAIGLPPLSAQRSRMKTRSASSSLMRATDASVSVRAAAERRKCWAIRHIRRYYRANMTTSGLPCQRENRQI